MTNEEAFIAALARRRILLAGDGGRLRFRAPEGALDAALKDSLRDFKPGLIKALETRVGFVQLALPSYNQLSLFFLYLSDPSSAAYNLALSARFREPVDVACLRRALVQTARHHGQLRTTLGHVQVGETAVLCQFVNEQLEPTLEEFDATGATDEELHELAQTFYASPIDLEDGPVLQAGLFVRSANDQILVVKLHHLAADGWSLRLLARDLGRHYASARRGDDKEATETTATYAEFALEQRDFLESEAGGQFDYWERTLQQPLSALEFALGRPRPRSRRSHGRTLYFELDATEQEKIETCAKNLGATTFSVLLASFQVFLMRQSRQIDVAIGVPTLGRRNERSNDVVGYFVNPVAVRSRRSPGMTFRQHAQRTAQEMAEALDHRDVPFAALVEHLKVKRDTARTPVFQVLFNVLSRRTLGDVVDLIYPSAKEIPIDFGGSTATSFALDQQEGQFDLTLEFVDRGDGLFGLFKYCTDLFTTESAQQMLAELREVLESATANPDAIVVEEYASPAAPGQTEDREPPRKVVVASTFTGEALSDALTFWFRRLEWNFEIDFAPFNQVFQTLLDPSSVLRSNPDSPGLILLRLDDLTGRIEAASEGAEWVSRAQNNLDELAEAIEVASQAAQAPLIVAICPSSPKLQEYEEERHLRQAFAARLDAKRGVHLLTPEQVEAWYPVEDFYEPLGEELGSIPYTGEYLVALASGVVRTLHATTNRACKALAVDCDNTLWAGVVGEDGPEGVVIGPDQKAFQEFLLEQYEAGVVVCLCSKNQEADVWAVFESHPDMVLRREHVGFWRINWQPKSQNIRELAEEINIGVDAIAFLDDSEIERGEVSANAPSVLIPAFPQEWSERVPYMRHVWALDRLRITEEDRKRNEHYRSERRRSEVQDVAGSLDDFLRRLQLVVDTHVARPEERERLAQLSMRTNQFNTTVQRLTLQQVQEFACDPDRVMSATRVHDRFGDYGLVGATFARTEETALVVELLLLSCRALGRSVEYRMAAWLGAQAKERGCQSVAFPVVTTDRNEPARLFLAKLCELCEGNVDDNGTLHVDASRLARVDDTPLASAAPAAPTRKASKPSAGVSWSPLVLQVASELRTTQTVDAALKSYLRERRKGRRTNGRPQVSLTRTEQTISEAWKRVLTIEDVGGDENFFDLGGTSVLMARLAVDLGNHGLKVSLVDLLQYPTVAALAKYLSLEDQSEPILMERSRVRHLAPPFVRLRHYRGR